ASSANRSGAADGGYRASARSSPQPPDRERAFYATPAQARFHSGWFRGVLMEPFWSALKGFFASNTLSPHGICLLWRPELIWTHATSDIVIGLAYFSIPLAISAFLYRRPAVRFGWALWMFVAFILLCGVTHFMSGRTLWRPYSAAEGLVKVATAVASILTAVALWPLLPKVIALPSS